MAGKLSGKQISDLTLAEDAISCGPQESLENVLDTMKKNRIGSIVITDSNESVLGIFTERDYLMKIAGKEVEYLSDPIEHFMTPDPKCVTPTDSIYRAVVSMRMGRFRHIVVTDPSPKLHKVISIKDIMDYMIDEFEQA